MAFRFGKQTDALSDLAFDALERRERDLVARWPALATALAASPEAASEAGAGRGDRASRVGAPPLAARSPTRDAAVMAMSAGLAEAVPHLRPMASLDNAMSEAELEAFLGRAARRLAKVGFRVYHSRDNMVYEQSRICGAYGLLSRHRFETLLFFFFLLSSFFRAL